MILLIPTQTVCCLLFFHRIFEVKCFLLPLAKLQAASRLFFEHARLLPLFLMLMHACTPLTKCEEKERLTL